MTAVTLPVVGGPGGTKQSAIAVVIVGPDGSPGGGGDASEATLEAIEGLLATPATALPPVPLSDGTDLTRVTIDFTASTDQAVIAGVTGKVITVYRVRLSANKPVTIEVWDGPSSTGTKKETIQLNGTNGGIVVFDFSPKDPYYHTTASNGLILKCSDATARVTGRMSYTQA